MDESGDGSGQLASWELYGVTARNTRAGKLYWKLTNSGTTRTVDIYKDTGGAAANKVATGSRTGDGAITLTAANSSGITGTVTVTYTIDDTDLTTNILEVNRLLIAKADCDSPATAPMAVLDADISNNANGTAYLARHVTGLDTSAAGAVGDPVYLSATAGAFTFTAPSGSDQTVYEVGRVVVDHATLGIIAFFPGNRMFRKAGTSFFQNDSVSNAVLRDSGACSVIGRSANSSGDPADISASANDTMLVRQLNVVQFVAWSTILFSDAEGDPTDVSLTAAADGTSAFAARRDHRHVLNQAIAPTWTGQHIWNSTNTRDKLVWHHGASLRGQVGVLDGATTWGAMWLGSTAPSDSNMILAFAPGDSLVVNGPGNVISFRLSNSFYAGLTTSGLAIGATNAATGSNVLLLNAGTAWTPVADAAAMWVADIGIGNAGLNFLTEAGNQFIFGGYPGATTYSVLWADTNAPDGTNYILATNLTDTFINVANASGKGYMAVQHGAVAAWSAQGFAISLAALAPVSGTNVFMISSGTAWTAVADAIALRSADSAAANANLWVTNEQGVLKQLSGLDAFVAANVTNDSATLATVTGLSVNVAASRTYKIKCILHVTLGATGEGVQVAIAGTATANSIQADVKIATHDATPVWVVDRISAMAGSVTSGATVGTPDVTVTIEGTIEVNAAGTLLIQFAKAVDTGAANTTVLRSSSLVLTGVA